MFHEVYRDQDLLAVDKPAGLLCVPGLSSPDNLFDRVRKSHPNARVVHRLDMATSGLVLFALHYDAQRALAGLFEKRAIRKSYSAVVHGLLSADSGEIALPLVCDWDSRPRQKICWQTGKPALTRFLVESADSASATTRVRLFPVTGRTHQLRVHMLALGHPIVGDELYLDQVPPDNRLLLHAESLQFVQPLSEQPLTLSVPCPF